MAISAMQEPRFRVGAETPPIWREALNRRLIILIMVTALGISILAASGNMLLPFERLHVLHGAVASKADYLMDRKVREILFRHRIQMVLTRTGSREIYVRDLKGVDFAFPSGRLAAELILNHQRSHGLRAEPYRPFVSPLVLGSFREYAEMLVKAKVAEPIDSGEHPLYYRIRIRDFLELMRQGKTWDDLKGNGFPGPADGRRIGVRTSDLCTSNGAATYLALVAWVENGGKVVGPAEAVTMANRIRPMLPIDTLADDDVFLNYKAPIGPAFAPIVAIYEHQYLGYQMERRAAGRGLDRERVLLYPDPQILTQPELIALKGEQADELGRLFVQDPQLRRRAVELGFRILDADGVEQQAPLSKLLQDRGVPVPDADTANAGQTTADLPIPNTVERMILHLLPSCPKAAQ